jgi:hypothetical protein
MELVFVAANMTKLIEAVGMRLQHLPRGAEGERVAAAVSD